MSARPEFTLCLKSKAYFDDDRLTKAFTLQAIVQSHTKDIYNFDLNTTENSRSAFNGKRNQRISAVAL